MQTPKARAGTLEVSRKGSPGKARTPRQSKIAGSDSDSVSFSRNSASGTQKENSSKVTERKSPHSPTTEKKRINKVSQLESQIAQLQEDFKQAKEQLNTAESCKRSAQHEAEEVKKKLLTMSKELEDSQRQLMELSTSEDDRIQELRQLSHDRDRAWQSELEAVQKQHNMDLAALSSAIKEIQKLKFQLERVSECEANQTQNVQSAEVEIQDLRVKLAEAVSLIERLESEIENCKESEARAMEVVGKTQVQLELANATVEKLQAENIKESEANKSLSLEWEQAQEKIKSLEENVSKLQADLVHFKSLEASSFADDANSEYINEEPDATKNLKAELLSLKSETEKLRADLDLAERRYQEEYIQSTLQIRSAYEQMEHTKSESRLREAHLQAELNNANSNIEEMSKKWSARESQLHSVLEKNEGLNLNINGNLSREPEVQLVMDHKELEAGLAELKANLLERETKLQNITEENRALKMEIEKSRVNDEVNALAEEAKAKEREALKKLDNATEEADLINRKVARVTEQLDAAQAANSEMEAELRRLKVQSDQWRKAAEAAAAMLSTRNNGKIVEKTGFLDDSFLSIPGKMGSPCLEDSDDDSDSPKKKKSNVLKKFGILWKGL